MPEIYSLRSEHVHEVLFNYCFDRAKKYFFLCFALAPFFAWSKHQKPWAPWSFYSVKPYKTTIDAKVNKYWYTVLRKSTRTFLGSFNRELNKLPSETKFATGEQHKFCAANIKSCHQRKIFWEIFATFNFSIVLLAAQVNHKNRKWNWFQRPVVIK